MVNIYMKQKSAKKIQKKPMAEISGQKVVTNKSVNKKRKVFVITTLLILVLGFVAYSVLVSNRVVHIEEKISNKISEIKPNESEKNTLGKNEACLKNIQSLSQNVSTLEEKLTFLNIKISELEASNEKINIQPQKLELIRLALAIDNSMNHNQNYSNQLAVFSSLSKNNIYLQERVHTLDLHKNNFPSDKIIINDFNVELENFISTNNILSKNKDSFSRFISNFVIIRKVENAEDNTPEAFVNELEAYIKSKNYGSAFSLIENNSDDSKNFLKTKENLRTNVLLNITIQEMIDYLINN